MNRRALIKSLLSLPAASAAIPFVSKAADLDAEIEAFNRAPQTLTLITSTDISPVRDYSATYIWKASPDTGTKCLGKFKVQYVPVQTPRLAMRSGNRFGKSKMAQEWMKSLTEIRE